MTKQLAIPKPKKKAKALKPKLPTETYGQVMMRAKRLCEKPGCRNWADDVHHIVPQTRYYLAKYGAERIHSLENLVAVCRPHHQNYAWCKERKRELIQKWDEELKLRETQLGGKSE